MEIDTHLMTNGFDYYIAPVERGKFYRYEICGRLEYMPDPHECITEVLDGGTLRNTCAGNGPTFSGIPHPYWKCGYIVRDKTVTHVILCKRSRRRN